MSMDPFNELYVRASNGIIRKIFITLKFFFLCVLFFGVSLLLFLGFGRMSAYLAYFLIAAVNIMFVWFVIKRFKRFGNHKTVWTQFAESNGLAYSENGYFSELFRASKISGNIEGCEISIEIGGLPYRKNRKMVNYNEVNLSVPFDVFKMKPVYTYFRLKLARRSFKTMFLKNNSFLQRLTFGYEPPDDIFDEIAYSFNDSVFDSRFSVLTNFGRDMERIFDQQTRRLISDKFQYGYLALKEGLILCTVRGAETDVNRLQACVSAMVAIAKNINTMYPAPEKDQE